MRRTVAALSALALVGLGVTAWHSGRADAPRPASAEPPRRPVALAVVEDGKRLLVANRRGTVSVVDVEKQQVIAEAHVGRRLADLAVTPDGRVLVADEEAHQLMLLSRRGDALEVVQRLDVAASPVGVRVSDDGRLAFVTGLWSRSLSIVELGKASAKVLRTVDLSFAPRALLVAPGTARVIVADAFGGRLAVVDPERGAVESVRELPGHNVRGLALTPDGKELLVTHQLLSEKAQTTEDDVHWGNLIANHLRSLRMAAVLDPKADLLDGSSRYELGHPGRGAADPAGLAVTSAGRLVVALAGVGEVSVGKVAGGDGERVAVGRRPTAVALSPDGRRAYVADTFADAVVVLDVSAARVVTTVSLGKAGDPTPADRGEMLFYDGRLSHEGWMSCHSCHGDGHSNGLLADTLGDGDFGAPKRVPSLRGVKDTGPWAWNGSVATLSEQVSKSLTLTMRGPKPSDDTVRDLTAYLETLSPPPPRKDATDVERGRAVFERLGCGSCHAPPAYTTARTYDVGLNDERGRRLFNPPSLRGVGQGGPYFHDGRAATLEDVLTRQRHQLKGELPEAETADLLRFLRSL